MKKRMGIEFEMVVYHNDRELAQKFYENLEEHGFEIKDDGSINADDRYDMYCNADEIEAITEPFDNIELLLETINKVFFSKDNPYTITINEDGGDIRVDFNDTTGTHIHFSSHDVWGVKCYPEERDDYDDEEDLGSYDTSGTIELKYFNSLIARKMAKYIHEHTKQFPTIQNAYFRNYARKYISEYDRYSAINIGNAKDHGTIEFRMCNLRGVKTKTMLKALKLQINLIMKSLAIGYKDALSSMKSRRHNLIQERKNKIIELNNQIKDLKKEKELLKQLSKEVKDEAYKLGGKPKSRRNNRKN